MRNADLREPAVGGEYLVLLIHVHNLVERHSKLNYQR
jgi:hypothetical protein